MYVYIVRHLSLLRIITRVLSLNYCLHVRPHFPSSISVLNRYFCVCDLESAFFIHHKTVFAWCKARVCGVRSQGKLRTDCCVRGFHPRSIRIVRTFVQCLRTRVLAFDRRGFRVYIFNVYECLCPSREHNNV